MRVTRSTPNDAVFPTRQKKEDGKFRYEAVVLTAFSFCLSVGFPLTILCGLISVTFSCTAMCLRTSRLTIYIAISCGCVCALGNLVVAVAVSSLSYCQNNTSACDETAWQVLGPIAGVFWIVACSVISKIPVESVSETRDNKSGTMEPIPLHSVTSTPSSEKDSQSVGGESHTSVDLMTSSAPLPPILHLDDPMESRSNASFDDHIVCHDLQNS